MNTPLAAIPFVFGALLLLIGLFGGGFEVRELKLPKISTAGRFASTVLGFLFVGVGFVFIAAGLPDTQGQPSPSAPPSTTHITVYDQLGDWGLDSEQIHVTIDGRDVGELTVNSVHPESHLAIELPSSQTSYSYTLWGESEFYDSGTLMRAEGMGSGTLRVHDGDRFDVYEDITTTPWTLSLAPSPT